MNCYTLVKLASMQFNHFFFVCVCFFFLNHFFHPQKVTFRILCSEGTQLGLCLSSNMFICASGVSGFLKIKIAYIFLKIIKIISIFLFLDFPIFPFEPYFLLFFSMYGRKNWNGSSNMSQQKGKWNNWKCLWIKKLSCKQDSAYEFGVQNWPVSK